MKDYNISIKGDDNLLIILKELIKMFIKSFMNSVKDIGQKLDSKKAKELQQIMLDIMVKTLNLNENDTI